MTERKISYVYRDDIFSPNNVENDSHILDRVAELLSPYFPDSEHLTEMQFSEDGARGQIIINMCRSRVALERLIQYHKEGRLVINSGYGIINCFRDNLTRIMQLNQVPMPKCFIIDTKEDNIPAEVLLWDEFWVKRGEGHSMVKNDIQQVTTKEQALEAIHEYRQRNISSVVLAEHVEGDLVKFYGIKDSDYFFCFYPSEEAHSKFGQELLSPKCHRYTYDRDHLYNICQKLATELDIDVFGGDCIITEDHRISLIDFNDWPSFAPCLEDGARHIANHILLCITQYLSEQQSQDDKQSENETTEHDQLKAQ